MFSVQREVVSALPDRAACFSLVHTSQNGGVFEERVAGSWLLTFKSYVLAPSSLPFE